MADRLPIRLPADAHVEADPGGSALTLGELMDAPHPLQLLLSTIAGDVRDHPLDAAQLAVAPFLKSIGKPLSDMLGTILTPSEPGTGLPSRIRITNFDARKNQVQLHGADKTGQPFEASPTQLDSLLEGEQIGLAQPSAGQVAASQRKIASALDASMPSGKSAARNRPASPKRALSEGEEAGIQQLDRLMEAIHGPDYENVRPNPKGHGTYKGK